MKYSRTVGDLDLGIRSEASPEDFRKAEELLAVHLLQKVDLAKSNNLAFYWTDVEFTFLRALLVQRIDHYVRKQEQQQAEQAQVAGKGTKK